MGSHSYGLQNWLESAAAGKYRRLIINKKEWYNTQEEKKNSTKTNDING